MERVQCQQHGNAGQALRTLELSCRSQFSQIKLGVVQGPDRGEVGSLHIGKIPSADGKKMCQALWETEAQVWLDKRLVVRHVKAHVAAGSSQQVDGEGGS